MKKNVLITGASGNLGTAAVDRFLSEGYHVIVTVTPGKESPFEAGDDLTVYEADLSNETQTSDVISRMIETHKTIDAALLLVGGFSSGNIEKTDLSAMHKMIELNFDTAYTVARPVFLQMKRQNGGRIVMVGSRPGLYAGDGKNFLAYAMSKAMIFKLSDYLNADGADSNVVSSVIVPGVIDTPANRKAMPKSNFNDWVTPEEISSVLSFLCSDNAKSLREPVIKVFGNS